MIFLDRRIRLRRYDGGFVPSWWWGMLGITGACIGGKLQCFRPLSGKQEFSTLQVNFVTVLWVYSNEMSV